VDELALLPSRWMFLASGTQGPIHLIAKVADTCKRKARIASSFTTRTAYANLGSNKDNLRRDHLMCAPAYNARISTA
jgi:hypothetical protein